MLNSGKVKAKIICPLTKIYENYFSNTVKPPIGEYIRGLKSFGYPDDVLEMVLTREQTRSKDKIRMENVIESIFGKYSTKSSSKPKKATTKEQLTKRLKK